MVLKRFLTMALGALGLGALAAGTALGQPADEGNIPAPDIFDDQITCTMNVPSMTPTPTVIPMGGMMSPLDRLIDDGDMEIVDNIGLGFVIEPGGNNCGGAAKPGVDVTGDGDFDDEGDTAPVPAPPSFLGVDANRDGDFDDEGDTPPEDSIPADVAQGYSELLGKFVAVYGKPDETSGGTARALEVAQKALTAAIERGETGSQLDFEESEVTRMQEAHDKAKTAFTDASAGPIYQAGVAEWMAKAVVTQSVEDYNDAVRKANTARGVDEVDGDGEVLSSVVDVLGLDGLAYANYVPLGNERLTESVFTFDDGELTNEDRPDLTQLELYANADLTNPQFATVSEDVEDTDGDESGVTSISNMDTNNNASNFDAAGRLVVPMNRFDEDGNPVPFDGVLGAVKDPMTVAQVRIERDKTKAAAEALAELRDVNLNPVLQTIYDEAARRAQVEADYYSDAYTAMLGDTTNLNGTTTDGVFMPNPDLNSTPDIDESTPYSIASRNRAFQAADNARFTAEQTLRHAVAAREAATEGVQAAFTNPQSFYQQLVDRRQALKVAADRKVAAAAEDGGTVSEDVTEAATAAAEALAAAEEAQAEIAGLYDPDSPTAALVQTLLETDGDDGQALVDAIAATYETAAGAADAAREVVEELTGEGGAVSVNTADIETLDGRVTVNEGAILANAGNITMNAAGILANRTDIDTNTAGIATNAGDILTNAGNISMNSGRIDANETAIGMNTSSIADNASMIGSNQAGISDNRAMIGELSESLEVVRAGVAASMALAGMPAINGRGISIGVGSFDGESAFAVGFQIQGEMASFKVGLTSGGGATGASAGVGFQF